MVNAAAHSRDYRATREGVQGPPAGRRRSSAVLEHAGVLAAYALLTLIVTSPLVLTPRDAIVMDPQIAGWRPGDGDPWHYLWGIWLVGRAFTVFPPPLLWTDLVFFPVGFDIPFLPGVGLVLGPGALLASVLGLVLSYNVLWWASFVLAGYTMYLLVRALTADRTAAFVCGGLFACSSYRLIHSVEHLPIVVASFLVPWFALALVRVGREPTAGRHAAAALVLAASAGISWYCTVSLLIYLGVVLAVAGWERGIAGLRAVRLVPILFAVVVFVLAAAPFTLPLILSSGRDSIVNRPLSDSTLFSADLLAFFVPSPRNPVFGGLTEPLYRRFTGNPYEQTVYLGYVVLAMALVGVLRWPRARTRLFQVAAATAFLLALGPFLHVAGSVLTVPLPYLLLRHVPFVRGVRVPSRFTELLLVALLVLAGYGLAKVWARRTMPVRLAIAGLVLAAGLVETALGPLPLASARAPAVYAEIGRMPDMGTLVDLPLDRLVIKPHYYQTIHGKRMLIGNPVRPREKYQGYPAGLPLIPYLEDPTLLLDAQDPEHARRDAQRLVSFFDVRYVVIHGDYLEPRAFERLDRFIADNFQPSWRRAEGTVVAYGLPRVDPVPTLWPERLVVDFGGPPREFALRFGWSYHERWGDGGPTIQWTSDRESSVVVALGAPTDRTLELRMFPFAYPGSPPQTVTIDVNGIARASLVLTPDWGTYRVPLAAASFRSGLNTLTFRYRYTRSPADVFPGSLDARTLAVAFDYLALGPRH